MAAIPLSASALHEKTTHSSFAANAMKHVKGSLSKLSKHDALTKESQRVIAQAFFGNLLKQMHEGPFKNDMFSGGKGGKAFSSMLDQHLAERMAGGSGQKLVNAMVHAYERVDRGPRLKPDPSKKAPWQSRFPGQYQTMPKDKIEAKDRRPNVTTDFRA